MSVLLAGRGSTNSRGLGRPLPPGAVEACTISADGVTELTEFTYADGRRERQSLLTWVVGQHGCLWHDGPYPPEIAAAHRRGGMPGTYAHAAEYELRDVLGEVLDGLFTAPDLAARFFQDGGTPLVAAARLARYAAVQVAQRATGRWDLASFGYHGAGLEWAHEPGSAGILPEAIKCHHRFEWGDVHAVRAMAKHSAAVCVEVPPVDDDEACAFLAACRKACDDGGAVFIVDEVVTGFRVHPQGILGLTGVKADIACYGKAIASRGKLSAIVGRRDLVEPVGGKVFCSTTFGGHPESCADGAATVRYLAAHPELYEQMNLVGSELVAGLSALGIRTVGQPTRSVMQFPTDAEWLAFCSQMAARGISMHRPQFVIAHHNYRHVARTLEAAAAECLAVAAA